MYKTKWVSNMYFIYDENGELMRWVKTKAEANHLIKIYDGWFWAYKPKVKPTFVWEDAPF